MSNEIDLKAAINAISVVVQNRPRPLREVDQIYMRTGDMVMQAELIARWSDGKRIAFIGDGDAISVCAAYLNKKGIVGYGPSRITVFDFDERIVSAVRRFADRERLENLSAELYNCLDALPTEFQGPYDMFYTNPPWGATNGGRSVHAFLRRGIEAIGYEGAGLVVIADDDDVPWPRQVLHSTQQYALNRGFLVSKMQPKLHMYHLDDAPDLRSCNLFFKSVPDNERRAEPSRPITDTDLLANFYGRDNPPRHRYVRENKRVDYGRAPDSEYRFEPFAEQEKSDD